ncbi:MAG: hypothetical protein Q9183_003996 [Haloplaca sp. 2 TL-2023]
MHLAGITLLALALTSPALAAAAKKTNSAASKNFPNAQKQKSASNPPLLCSATRKMSITAPESAHLRAPSPPTSNLAHSVRDAKHFLAFPSNRPASALTRSFAVA